MSCAAAAERAHETAVASWKAERRTRQKARRATRAAAADAAGASDFEGAEESSGAESSEDEDERAGPASPGGDSIAVIEAAAEEQVALFCS